MGGGPTALLEQHGLEERLSSAGFDVAVDTVEVRTSTSTIRRVPKTKAAA